jgi:nitronate monooxygenase
MAEPLAGLARRPVVVAPMAGGPSTHGLVIAAAAAGALGFLAAGYKTAAALRAEMDAVRAGTGAPFGVNVFVPGEPAADRTALARYLAELEPDAAALGARPGAAGWDDDGWDAKLGVLLAGRPRVTPAG